MSSVYVYANWKPPPEVESSRRFGQSEVVRARFRTAIESGHSWGCASSFARRGSLVYMHRHCFCILRRSGGPA